MQKEISNFVLKKNMSDNYKKGRNRLTDIFRYKRDELSGEERNSFEKELQKDAFAEEAVEGLNSLSEQEALNDIYDLGNRIKTKTARRRRFNFYRIAASIAVLMMISSIFIIIEKNNTGDHLTVTSAQPDTLEIAEIKPVKRSINAGQPSEKQVSIPDKTTDKSMSRKSVISQQREEQAAKKQVDIPDQITDKMVIGKSVISQQREEQAAKKQVDIPDQITDKMVIGKSVISQQPVTAPLNAMANTRSLKSIEAGAEDEAEDEVKVKAKVEVEVEDKAEVEDKSKDYIPPLPVNGKSNFETYIRKNLHWPDTSISERTVVVVVSFLVNYDGRLDRIKVIRSPGKSFSDEAIRVIKSGPAWKPAEEKGIIIEDTVRVRIVFR